MRKNCQQVVSHWLMGQELRKAPSIWTDGESIYSYNTVILANVNGNLVLNRTKYSSTTTTHQNAIAAWLEAYGLNTIEAEYGTTHCVVVENVPIGSKSDNSLLEALANA